MGEFARALELLAAGLEINYTGAAGEVDFNELGEVATAIEIWRFTEDSFETVMVRRAEEIPSE